MAELLPRLPALLIVTDASGSLQVVTGDVVEELGIEAGALDYIGTVFGRASAIFLETRLSPLLRREGRFDECHVLLQSPGGTPWPCLVSARRLDDGARWLWLFFAARERARFEAELVAARQSAQGLARELAEANQRLEAQSEAIRNRNSELDALARTDPLTGLGNRRALDAALLARPAAPPDGTPSTDSALLMVDADHFKAINDRWGHDVGDTVLVAMAGVLRTCLRCSDTVARLGGEEFALWLPEATAEAAVRVAETVHARMAAVRLPDAAQTLTVSIGVAMLGGQRDRNDLALLLKRADGALYVAKRAGRHCTRWADAPHGTR
ncbi:MAG: GGDEF domain-containing protein [Lysobacteraceae bacterium]